MKFSSSHCVCLVIEPRPAQMVKQPVVSCDIVFGRCLPALSEYECSMGGVSSL
jgi:hypothetical protein